MTTVLLPCLSGVVRLIVALTLAFIFVLTGVPHAFAGPAPAASAQVKNFDLPADTAERSIKRFSEQSGLEVFYPSSATSGLHTQPVKGRMSARGALDAMIAGTGLTVVQDEATGAFSVKRTGNQAGSDAPASTSGSADATRAAGKRADPPPAPPETMERRPTSGTGTVSGRVLNETTGQYLLGAMVMVAGTNISTVSERGGNYTLLGVSAGEAHVFVAFLGLEPADAVVPVSAGQTATRDFNLSRKGEKGEVVILKAYEVVSEREGNYKAMQQQKSALEIKSVVSADAFGDVSEGNVGEFLKLMPGVMLDYVDADVRTASIGGLDPKYGLILMDGAPVASAGSSNMFTGRAFEFEQLSISSIETVELSKTPTPDVAGSALAGVINLRSKGAFDRRGRQIRWSTGIEMNSNQMTLKRTPGPADHKTYKIHPNFSLEFSDVVFGGKLGVLAGLSTTQVMVEQNNVTYGYNFDSDRSNNATEIPRLGFLQMTDAPKITTRSNYNLRLDYKFSPDLSVWGRVDFNTYAARNYRRDFEIFLNNVNNNTPGVEYSLSSQTTINSQVFPRAGFSFDKNGTTATFSTGASYKRGAFRADLQAQLSRALSTTEDLPFGFFTTIVPELNNVSLRWTRNGSEDPGINLTQLTQGDWRDPASYPTSPTYALRYGPQTGREDRWTGKADFRYDWQRGYIPVLFKWGGDIGQQSRNVQANGTFNITFLGPDGIANTVDDRWIPEAYRIRSLAGGNLQNIPIPDRFAAGRTYGAHPEWFTAPRPEQLLQRVLTTRRKVKEQVDSLYQQSILKLSKKLTLAPGVRFERTRSIGIGPTDRGDRYAKNVLTGNPLASIPTNTVEYVQARYGSSAIVNNSEYNTWLKYLHATYRHDESLIFRASFNNSITRPDLSNLSGGVTINETSIPLSASIPNPNLKAESGRNFFTSAEYYFPKGAGFLTVSGARRDISNLIRSNLVRVPPGENFPNDDGLDLGGYDVTTTDNVGRAHLTSLEFSYRQNLVFLPGAWKKLSVFGNYTRLRFDNYENFRRPHHIANGGVSFDHRGLSLRWNVNWRPRYRQGAVNAAGVAGALGARLQHDAQLNYRFSKAASFFLTGRNVFNQRTKNYTVVSGDRFLLTNYFDNGTVWTAGVRGQF